MEFLNRIELRGVVGRADVNTVGGSRVCNFSVVTEYSGMELETTWFNVSAWGSREVMPDLSTIQKGCWVHVTGRLRLRRYTTQDNEERTSLDVMARTVKVLPREEDPLQPQRDY